MFMKKNQPTNEELRIELKNSINEVLSAVNNFASHTESRFERLEKGQEEIRMRLDNTVYRFEFN